MREKKLAFVFASVSGVRAVFPLPEIQMTPSGTFYIGSIVLKNRVGGKCQCLNSQDRRFCELFFCGLFDD